ncbi:3-phosphoshikimate 1-carboxyvinyltransferase [Arcobacter sp. FWKO B]|uniref:3-phosphoshikimate 1-carboxyvinyltransferase n=1 Tax=Arcobacter sp. FWKO B TaxID=2593672 RepID=UPI003A4C7FF6
MIVNPLSKPFDTQISDIASDKSISHRSAMFCLFSDKPSHIKNFLMAEDTLNTLNIVKSFGVTVEQTGKADFILTPPAQIKEPDNILDCGNSGTGMRLFCGLLASFEGSFVLTGDKYLRNRPMARVTKPLKSIGAMIDGREFGNKAPLHIRGSVLKAFRYVSPIDSAQVKSALILAALKGDGVSYYKEEKLSRDHTERMLNGMGANISTNDDGYIEIHPLKGTLKPLDITVPADPSSGFFFAVAAAIIPNAKVVIKSVTLNPTRIEAYKVLQKMGAIVEFIEHSNVYEPIGDIKISHNQLNGIEVSENIAWLIDELPALSIAMSQASGTSTVKNAKELRVKESDRISSVITNLQKCKITCSEFEDGYTITGGKLSSAVIDSHGDHRIAMSFAIAGLLCGMEIEDTECIMTSFPNFEELLNSLR